MPSIGAVDGINPKCRGDPGAGRFRGPLKHVLGPTPCGFSFATGRLMISRPLIVQASRALSAPE
jgi:hypothetical protein